MANSEEKWAGQQPSTKFTQKRKNPELPTKGERRAAVKHGRIKAARARVDLMNAIRPVCNLDKRAMELGVYSEEYHKKPRGERSALVHKALEEAA